MRSATASTELLTCPDCGQSLRSLGQVLCTRDEDRRRVCRHAWKCPANHLWWRWADRPAEPLDVCPHPQLFRR